MATGPFFASPLRHAPIDRLTNRAVRSFNEHADLFERQFNRQHPAAFPPVEDVEGLELQAVDLARVILSNLTGPRDQMAAQFGVHLLVRGELVTVCVSHHDLEERECRRRARRRKQRRAGVRRVKAIA